METDFETLDNPMKRYLDTDSGEILSENDFKTADFPAVVQIESELVPTQARYADNETGEVIEEVKKARKFFDPGWYRDLSIQDYHEASGYSSSSIKVLAEKTMEHLNYQRMIGSTDTRATLGGQVLHTLVLEPEMFDIEFGVRPDKLVKPTIRQITAKKPSPASVVQINAWRDWEDELGNRTEVMPEMYAQCKAMAEKVRAHPEAGFIFNDEMSDISKNSLIEQSVFYWYNPEDWDAKTGYDYRLMLKARFDKVLVGHNIIFDLKSSRDAAFSAFMKQAKTLGYDVSAAMYLDAFNRNQELLEHVGIEKFERFIWCVVENEPPYEVALYEASPADLNEGAQKYHHLVRKLDQYNRSEWKGYGDWDGKTEQILPRARESQLPPWGNKIV